MSRAYDFVVYIVASRSHQLYVGMTNDLMRRVAEHKERKTGAYTSRYGIDRLVYYEHTKYVLNAIARENELKDWNRARKIALIESVNPTWQDLSEDWGESNRRFLRLTANERQKATADSSASLRNDKQMTTADLSASLRNDK